MQEVIAQALLALAAQRTPTAVDAVAPTIRDAALLLDIHVHQFPGPLALIADHLSSRAVQLPKTRYAVATQDCMDRRGGLAQRPTDPVGPDPPGSSMRQDGPLAIAR